MPDLRNSDHHAPERMRLRRAQVAAIRDEARALFVGGAPGIQTASAISAATDLFIRELFAATVESYPGVSATLMEERCAVVAVGGTGRGELCPFSDVDLLFVLSSSAPRAVADCVAAAIREYWDAGLKLGSAVRTVHDTIDLARREADVATALIEARLLWGSQTLFDELSRKLRRKIVRPRRVFIERCISAREAERDENGSAVKQLEPDVKRSPGGLRDLHLLRWMGFAEYGTADVASLRLQGVFTREQARALLTAYEFLMRVRIDLHFEAGRSQDILTREDQLRIAEQRGIEATFGQRPVERFMQTYFRHSLTIADLCDRFITLHRRQPLLKSLLLSLVTHRSDGSYVVNNDRIDVLPRWRASVLSSLERILRFYLSAARYRVAPSPEFAERIREAGATLSGDLSPPAAELFLQILDCSGKLGAILRSMFRTGILEIVVPPVAHVRCLLQFNQYHSFTVDEHTFRAVEALEGFESDAGSLGEAYRAVKKKRVLHLAMLLHDVGKGFEEDHSEVGRAIAHRVAARLRMPDEDRDALMFLVHKHLVMAHRAFRRDISDPATVTEFSREIGSAEMLRMLYVLTAADVMAVGPGVWTDWKADLLSELYRRTLLLISGQESAVDPALRTQAIRAEVQSLVAGEPELLQANPEGGDALDRFPWHYLSTTPAERIIADLRLMAAHRPGDVRVEGRYDRETHTSEYRVATHEHDVGGCFHKVAGALTANRLQIISAQISTTSDGFVLDSFRVEDGDFAGAVPQERIDAVAASIRSTLAGDVAIEELFRKQRRFSARHDTEPISGQSSRVVIDNSSSDQYTVIDVFSHDRPGLLYTISRRLFESELSVVLAKIATHLDQVVDVFYVTDREGRKIEDPNRLRELQSALSAKLESFEQHERVQFAS